MARLVMKFGGTSVANTPLIRNVADHVIREVHAGHEVCVVVSAMAGKTDELVSFVQDMSASPDCDEYDAVVSSGEQVTAGLLALALQEKGIKARSWAGWQLPLKTEKLNGVERIVDLDVQGIISDFSQGKVAVIAGFQGLSATQRISTLGRGGSDLTAVALSAALSASRCDIYTDVDGVYTTDPRIEPAASRLSQISFEEMLEMASLGAKVLQVRSVELAMLSKVPILVRSSTQAPDSVVPVDSPSFVGTLICSEDEIMERGVVAGIAYTVDEAWVSFHCADVSAHRAADVFEPLARANINLDMIVQNIPEEGKGIDMTFTLSSQDLQRALFLLEDVFKGGVLTDIKYDTGVSKVSVIGVGMRSHAGIAATAFKTLAENNIDIRAVGTSEIKISFLIDERLTQKAVRALHAVFGLDRSFPFLHP